MAEPPRWFNYQHMPVKAPTPRPAAVSQQTSAIRGETPPADHRPNIRRSPPPRLPSPLDAFTVSAPSHNAKIGQARAPTNAGSSKTAKVPQRPPLRGGYHGGSTAAGPPYNPSYAGGAPFHAPLTYAPGGPSGSGYQSSAYHTHSAPVPHRPQMQHNAVITSTCSLCGATVSYYENWHDYAQAEHAKVCRGPW